MNRMLGYLKGYKRESVLAPLFKMLEATFDLFVPLVMADIVNVGIAAHDLHYILVRCGLLLLLAFVGLTCSLTAQYFSAKAAVGYSTALRHALFAHIQSLSFSEMDTLGTSTLITRMTSDVNQVQSGLNLFLRLFLRSPFVVLGAMVMAFTVNARAAMIFVVTIPLLSVVVFGVMVVTRPLYKTVQTRLDRVLGLTRENLTGVRVVRAFDKEQSEIDRFEDAKALLDYGFASYTLVSVYPDSPLAPIPVLLGEQGQVQPQLARECRLLVRKGQEGQITTKVTLAQDLAAPVEQGQTVGEMEVSLDGQVRDAVPILSAQGVERLTIPKIFSRLLEEMLMAG